MDRLGITPVSSSPSQPPHRNDRRRRNLPVWHPRRLRGRRMRQRRAEDHDRPYVVDRVTGRAFLTAALLLVLTLADGVITVLLLERGCEEANPLMRLLLERGVVAFLAGKYVLTAAFLPVALVLHQYRLFGSRLRVGQLVPAVAALYVALIVYQFGLWRASGARVVRPDAGVAASPGPGAGRGGVQP